MADTPVTVQNVTRETTLGHAIREARTFLARGRGLMLRPELQPGEGLIIDPCTSIHSFFMRFPIDVVYVNRENVVVRADSEFSPWRLGPIFTGSQWVIELPSGTIRRTGTQSGDLIRIDR